jgi:hypothetical protein
MKRALNNGSSGDNLIEFKRTPLTAFFVYIVQALMFASR